MREVLKALAALPPGGRFALAPGLAGEGWLVGRGEARRVPSAREALEPGAVVVLPYDGQAWAIRAAELRALPWAGDPVGRAAPASRPAASSLGRAAHEAAVGRIHELIRAGDCYQVNLTAQLAAPWAEPPELLFGRLCGAHPPACAAYVELPDRTICSASPETLLVFDAATRRAASLPIKGTRPRGGTEEEDERLARELAADPKERAEHVMIVDLVRNDLGRVCETASVRVPRLLSVERLPAVHHLVSEVEGTLEAGAELGELVDALFPAGSITGAPKERVIRRIAELEPVPRGAYCGAIGRVAGDGSCRLSVAIRTAVVADGVARYGAGGGITIDSVATAEWEELLVKAAPFLSAVGALPPC